LRAPGRLLGRTFQCRSGAAFRMYNPAAAACPGRADVTAEVTRQAAARIVDSYRPDCAGYSPR